MKIIWIFRVVKPHAINIFLIFAEVVLGIACEAAKCLIAAVIVWRLFARICEQPFTRVLALLVLMALLPMIHHTL